MQITEPFKAADTMVDMYLVAQAEKYAGGRCHEAANLIQAYIGFAQLCCELQRCNEFAPAKHARKMAAEAEVNLRKFLYQCRSIATKHFFLV